MRVSQLTLASETRDLAYLAESFEGGIGRGPRLVQRVEQGRNGFVDRTRSDDLLRDIESLRGRRADSRIRVHKSGPDCSDDGILVSLERRLAAVGHELGERQADTFALTAVVRGHRLLQDGNDLAQDSFAEPTARVGEATSGGFALLQSGAGEDPHDDRHWRKSEESAWWGKGNRPRQDDALRVGRISRTVRGVLETKAFQTPIAA